MSEKSAIFAADLLIMRPTKETYKAAFLYAFAKSDLDILTYKGEYDGCLVYHATHKMLNDTFSGYPTYIIVDKDLKCRFSTPKEALKFISLFEEDN